MQIANHPISGNQLQLNTKTKKTPHFKGINIKQCAATVETGKIKPLIPQKYIDAILNSEEMKKAGKIYEIAVSALGFRNVKIQEISKEDYIIKEVIIPHLQLSVSEKNLKNKMRTFAIFKEPKAYSMTFDGIETEDTFNRIKNLTKTDIDNFVQQMKENENTTKPLVSKKLSFQKV